MQSSEREKAIQDDKIGENIASVSCRAPTVPVNSKHCESHVDKTTALTDKNPISLLLKQNEELMKKEVPSVKITTPKIPASIEAFDVSSLLDKFLEYEINENSSVNMVKNSSVALTPVSSPSHKSSCNISEAFIGNKNTSVSTLGLTPPVSPPCHSNISAMKSSTNPGKFPKLSSNKDRESLSLPSRSMVESIKQYKDTVNDDFAKKFTSTYKGSSDVNTVTAKADKENTTAATKQKVSNEIPETSKSTSSKMITQESKCSGIQEQKREISELQKSEEFMKISTQSLKDKSTKLPKSILDATGSKIESSSGGYVKQKRCYSSDDYEEEDDDKDYQDYKRKKHATRDECYWSTSEDEEEERRKFNCSSRKRGNKKYHSRKRHTMHSSSSDSGDNSSYNVKSRRHSSYKRQRREDEGKKEESIEKGSLYDIETERKRNFKLDKTFRKTSTEKRKIVYIGNIDDSMTKGDVWRRFREYGPIDKVTVHFRTNGDNYAFVTYVDSSSALEAIEKGCKNPALKHLDICFGGRRKFCGGRYVDFDSNTSYLEEKQLNGNVSLNNSKEEMDFDALLKLCQRKSRR